MLGLAWAPILWITQSANRLCTLSIEAGARISAKRVLEASVRNYEAYDAPVTKDSAGG
jgi:hypothetical protein